MYDPFAPPPAPGMVATTGVPAPVTPPPMMPPSPATPGASPTPNAIASIYAGRGGAMNGGAATGNPYRDEFRSAVSDWRAGMPAFPTGGFQDPAARQEWLTGIRSWLQSRPHWRDWRSGPPATATPADPATPLPAATPQGVAVGEYYPPALPPVG